MTKAAELAKMGEVLTNSQIGGRRNIVINGAMQVAQRSTSSTTDGDFACLLYTSPSPRDGLLSRMPSSA